jgi:hypothetical protein
MQRAVYGKSRRLVSSVESRVKKAKGGVLKKVVSFSFSRNTSQVRNGRHPAHELVARSYSAYVKAYPRSRTIL